MKVCLPPLRRDIEFFPVQHQGRQFIVIRDHLGLVQEGKAVEVPLYQLMTMLDGTTTVRDLQMALMRQGGGVLVGSDEIRGVIDHLDDSFILDSERFQREKERVVADFLALPVRPSSHSGRAYPEDPQELRRMLEGIMALGPDSKNPPGRLLSLVAPHIDLTVGGSLYARAYGSLKGLSPRTVIILGIGHQMSQDLFALSEKDFATPLGVVGCDREAAARLRAHGGAVMAENDFAHRAEHSIEFQTLFLQHVLPPDSFRILPLLCGSLQITLREYSRQAYREKAGTFLEVLQDMVRSRGEDILVVAGVDFSHIGPKFGHKMPASRLQAESETHDKVLLKALSALDAEAFWEESRQAKDRYNLCGFAALACLLEVLPACRGHILGHETWHEEATRSAVSFAAMAFTAGRQRNYRAHS